MVLLCEGCSASLEDLCERHRAAGPAPAGTERGGIVYLVSPRHWGADKFSGGVNGTGLQQALTPDGMYLEFGSFGRTKSVWIPVSAFAGCSRSRSPSGSLRWRTNLWVEDSQVLIRFADERGDIAKWCRGRGLAVYDETMEGTWLQDKGRIGRLP